MRIPLSSMHNPQSSRYTAYYSVVLVAATATVFFTMFKVIHPNILQDAGTFFEGFFSLFMLGRNDAVGKALMVHLYSLPAAIRR